jgi:large subunit ribosomal protein L4
MKLDIITLDAKKAGSIDLDDSVFGVEEIRADILQRMVKYQLAKRRAGTHKTLSRGEVARSHSKLYRQKGTGQARHGAASAPIFRGGGHAHNRLPRDYSHDLPKKVRALALRHALSAKAQAGEIVVLEKAASKDGKTAALRDMFAKLEWTNALIIDGAELEATFVRAARNVPNIDVLPVQGINVYDILRRRTLVLTKAAVAALEQRFADAEVGAKTNGKGKGSGKAAAKSEAKPKSEGKPAGKPKSEAKSGGEGTR